MRSDWEDSLKEACSRRLAMCGLSLGNQPRKRESGLPGPTHTAAQEIPLMLKESGRIERNFLRVRGIRKFK